MKDKLKIIYKPIILTLILLVIGYTFLHWLIFIELKLFSLKKILLDFGIPITLVGLAAWIYIRPKLKILRLGDWLDFCTVLVWVGITAPLLIAQNYIQTSTGKLTELTSIKEITKYEETKYYSFKNYYIDKNTIGIYHDYEVIPKKYSSDLNMIIYVAIPFYESANDINLHSPIGWLGHEYRCRVSNSLSPEQKDKEFNKFSTKSQNDFNDRDFSKFTYFERLGNSKEFDGFSNAIKATNRFKPIDVILVGESKPYSERTGNSLFWIFGSSLISCIVWLIMISIPSYNEQVLNRVKAGKPDKEAQQDLKDFLGYITFRPGYVITPLLLYGIVIIFLIMAFGGYGFASFKGPDLIKFGANYSPLTKNGEWWRLLTCVFLHGGIMHLILNISGLIFISFILEPFLGSLKYLLLYLVSGILASATSLWWHDTILSIGASGAIFGLYGAYISLMLTKSIPDEIGGFFLSFSLVFIGISLLFGLTGGIDNAAHIGGLLSGFVIGFIYYLIIMIENKIKKSTAANTQYNQ